MTEECGPNFFVIGAAKCGTSSLRHYLDQHPEISMSRVKEPNVFADPLFLTQHEDYEQQFECGAALRGDASTAYSRYPVEGDAAARIHEATPESKLIYLVRDPLERIVSEYAQWVAVGVEQRPINEALRDFEDPNNPYVCASRYGMQANRYLEFFDRSALLVLEQAELRDQRRTALIKVFRFLDVDPAFRSPEFSAELWTRADHVKYQGLGWRLRGSVLGRAFRRLPLRLRLPVARAGRRLFRRAPEPELDPALRRALTEFLEPDLEQLRSITQTDLLLHPSPVG